MAWEVQKPNRRDHKPAISISKRGQVLWNKGAHEMLGAPEWVELLYNAEAQCIGLRNATFSEKGQFRIYRLGRSNTWGISATGALRSMSIFPTASFRGLAQSYGDGIFGIDLAGVCRQEAER